MFIYRYVGSVVGAGIVAVAAASPIMMVVGHKIGFPSSRPITNTRECGPECHAFLLALAAKLIALFGAIWAIYWRGSAATMPRLFFFRAVTLLLAFLAAFTFWLFYWVSEKHFYNPHCSFLLFIGYGLRWKVL